MAEQRVDVGAAARRRRAAESRRERVDRAQRELSRRVTRWRTANSRVMALQASGVSPTSKQLRAAKDRAITAAREVRAARDAVAAARGGRGPR